jgi:hypothetical protein
MTIQLALESKKDINIDLFKDSQGVTFNLNSGINTDSDSILELAMLSARFRQFSVG